MARPPWTLLLAVGLAPAALAQQVPDRATLDDLLGDEQVLHDFEAFVVAPLTEVPLDVVVVAPDTVTNGQGPGLVPDDVKYAAPALAWSGLGVGGLATKTLRGDHWLGILLVVHEALPGAMGFDLHAHPTERFRGRVDISGAPHFGNVGTLWVDVPAGGRVFVGWRHDAGISQVTIQRSSGTAHPIVDDHGFGKLAPGTRFCTSTPNSTGEPARLSAGGTVSIAADDLRLVARPVPDGQFAAFVIGLAPAQQPFGNGYLCVSGARPMAPAVLTRGGEARLEVDVAGLGVTPGVSYYTQAWFRDPGGGGAGFDTSDGLSFVFVP